MFRSVLSFALPVYCVLLVSGASDLKDVPTELPSSKGPSENDSSVREVTTNSTGLPEELYVKAHSYLKGTKAFKHFSFEDTRKLVDEVDTWEAPEEMQKEFPYYLSGYDYDDRPIWIAEVGKYDPRKYINKGEKGVAILEKYGFQAALRALKSALVKDSPAKEIREFVMIWDTEALDLAVVTHPPSIAFGIHYGQLYWDIAEKCLGGLIIVNANYPTEVAIQLARPIAGKLMERVEVFGTNKARFKSALRRRFPPESIPPWYGGDDGFKPVEVYG